MKLEQQVCSLELSKKLKELGVKQESLFYWSNCCEKEFTLECSLWHDIETWEWGNGHTLENVETKYSAFTVAELGEIHTENEADIRAKALIYLLENNKLK